jgi:hypothetical protein
MRVSFVVLASLAVLATIAGRPPNAVADACVSVEGPVITNRCNICMKVTVRNLAPAAEQSSGAFAGEASTIRVEPGKQATVPGAERPAITDLEKCG